jgi:hypothetical protein
MIMESMGRRKFLGGVKNNLVAGEDRLEGDMHRTSLNGINRVDLGYISLITVI